MAEKLEAYRARKRRKEVFDQIKAKIVNMIPVHSSPQKIVEEELLLGSSPEPTTTTHTATATATKTVTFAEDLASVISESSSEFVESDNELLEHSRGLRENRGNKCLRYILYAIFVLFWVTCYIIAIELKFGIVFLLFSALFAMYFNTRTGPRKSGEISAYSVFNENCESIDGTLTAEQFEKEMRFGPQSVR